LTSQQGSQGHAIGVADAGGNLVDALVASLQPLEVLGAKLPG
jgi:hypothetical protein